MLCNPTEGQVEPRNLESATQRLHTIRGCRSEKLAACRAALSCGGDRRTRTRAETDQYCLGSMTLARELTEAGYRLAGRAGIPDVAAVVPDDRFPRAFDVSPLDTDFVNLT